MKKIVCSLFIIAGMLCAGLCYGYDIPGFTKKDFGKVYDDFTTQHRNELIGASLKEKPVTGDSYPVDVIYSHTYVYVKKDGSFVEYTDYAMKINAPFVKNDLGERKFAFDSSREKIEVLKASVYTGEGKEIKTDVLTVKEKEPYTGLVYSDLKMKILTLKGLEDGSAIRIAYKKTYTPTEDKGYIFHWIGLNNNLPSKEKIYIYHFEAGAPIKVLERFRGIMPELQSSNIALQNGDAVYVYKMTNAKIEETEPGSIPYQEYSDRVFFYKPTTWANVGGWYYRLAIDKMVADKDLAAKVGELTKGLSKEEEKAKVLYDFVRNIRYVSIALNQHSMIPHPAAETFKNLYGDCKDKATLLIAMLKHAGIKAYIALVNTDYLIEKEIPTPLIFNHAIVAIPGPEGKYIFLDPTYESAPYGVLPGYNQYRNALIVKESGGELVLIPLDDIDTHTVEETISIDFKDLNSVKITTRAISQGEMELARFLNSMPEHKIKQIIQESLSKKYKQVEIDYIKFGKTGKEGEEIETAQLTINDFTKPMGNIYAFYPLEWADVIEDGTIIATAQRKTDIEFGSRKRIIAGITIKIPESATVEFVPENLSLKNEKFGEYQYTVTKTDKTITIHRSFYLGPKRIAAKDYGEFKAFYKRCMDQDNQNVLLRKKN